MGFAEVALAAGSTVLSGIGAHNESQAQKAQARFQSALARNNAIIAENNAQYEEQRAQDAKERGASDADVLRRKVAQFQGQQRSAAAGSGVVINTGSPLDAIVDTAYLGEIDVQNRLTDAEREAFGLKQNAANLRNEAATGRASSGFYANAAKNISPLATATSTLLAGASTVASRWDAWKNSSPELPKKISSKFSGLGELY